MAEVNGILKSNCSFQTFKFKLEVCTTMLSIGLNCIAIKYTVGEVNVIIWKYSCVVYRHVYAKFVEFNNRTITCSKI